MSLARRSTSVLNVGFARFVGVVETRAQQVLRLATADQKMNTLQLQEWQKLEVLLGLVDLS